MAHETATREFYEAEGYALCPRVLDDPQLLRATTAMADVVAGRYETDIPPHATYGQPTGNPDRLVKIDQPQISNRIILKTITNSDLGRFVADFFGAELVQIWAVQLLHKPSATDRGGIVGWHQDMQYWTDWFTPESEIFTAWLALSDVGEASGPMRFIPGSHTWFGDELAGGTDFFNQEGERQRDQIPVPAGRQWREVPAVMPAGAFSLHHRRTLHGSGPNTSGRPRLSFALHMRTERSTVRLDADAYYTTHLDDPIAAPVIFGR